MKNVFCFKLSIDRSKVFKKMGIFKDIFLFGNYLFFVEGDFIGGIIVYLLVGVGKEVKKIKV